MKANYSPNKMIFLTRQKDDSCHQLTPETSLTNEWEKIIWTTVLTKLYIVFFKCVLQKDYLISYSNLFPPKERQMTTKKLVFTIYFFHFFISESKDLLEFFGLIRCNMTWLNWTIQFFSLVQFLTIYIQL